MFPFKTLESAKYYITNFQCHQRHFNQQIQIVESTSQLLNMLKRGLLVTKLGLELGMAKTH